MTTVFESDEGRIRDQAASSSNFIPGDRLWIAAGRRRLACDLNDLSRKPTEDRSFSSSAYAENFEQVICVEVDPLHKRLYTLTARALYREDITVPAAPISPLVFDFFAPPVPLLKYNPSVGELEEVRDLRVWGPDSKVVVLTSRRIIVFNDSGTALTKLGETVELNPATSAPIADPSCLGFESAEFSKLKVSFLHKLRLMQDEGNGKVLAYVLAEALGYQVSIRPRPLILLLCELNAAGWTAPSFDADPSAGLYYAWWNPMPPGLSFSDAGDWTAYGLDVAVQGASRFVYVGCGKNNEVYRVDVSHAFPRTCSAQAGPLPATKFGLASGSTATEKVLSLLVDPFNSTRFFALTQSRLYAREAANTFTQAEEGFGSTSLGDLLDVRFPANEPVIDKLYTLGGGVVGHVRKSFDVTVNNASTSYPRAVTKHYGMWGSDGAVMIGDRVFVPTFAGVVKFEPAAGTANWQVVQSSYQSTEALVQVPGSFQYGARATEHVDVAKIPGAVLVDRVVTASVNGGFDEFPFKPLTTNLEAMLRHTPSALLMPSAPPWSWPTGNIYGNDLAFFDMGNGSTAGQQFVLTDLTLGDPGTPGAEQPRNAALLAWRWDTLPVTPIWKHTVFQQTYTFNPALLGGGVPITDTIAVNKVPGLQGAPDRWFAFVTTGESFYSADISALNTATPSIAMKSAIPCDTLQKVRAGGIAASKDRLFVYVNGFNNGGAVVPPQVRVYQWDTATGVVTNPMLSNYSFDVSSVGSPTRKLGGGYRMRFNETNATTGEGDLYIATDSGEEEKSVLLRMHWGGLGSATPNNVSFTGTWKSDYEDAMQDCRLYTLTSGQRVVLVAKDRETFALVLP